MASWIECASLHKTLNKIGIKRPTGEHTWGGKRPSTAHKSTAKKPVSTPKQQMVAGHSQAPPLRPQPNNNNNKPRPQQTQKRPQHQPIPQRTPFRQQPPLPLQLSKRQLRGNRSTFTKAKFPVDEKESALPPKAPKPSQHSVAGKSTRSHNPPRKHRSRPSNPKPYSWVYTVLSFMLGKCQREKKSPSKTFRTYR